MPRYYGYSDPSEYYSQQGTFNPFTGRLEGGQLIAQLLSSMAAGKRRKKEEAWELEDRAWQGKQRAMAEEQAGREKEEYEYRKTQRSTMTPGQRATAQNVIDYWNAKSKEQARIREIEAMKNADIEKANAKPPASSQDRLYEWQANVTRSSDILENELTRLNQENLVYAKQLAENPDDPDLQASVGRQMISVQQRMMKAKMILHRLSNLKVGDPIPLEIQKMIEEYISPTVPPPSNVVPGPSVGNPLGAWGPSVGRNKTEAEKKLPAGFSMLR